MDKFNAFLKDQHQKANKMEKTIIKSIDKVIRDSKTAVKVSESIIDKLECIPPRPDYEYFSHEALALISAKAKAQEAIELLEDITEDIDKVTKDMRKATEENEKRWLNHPRPVSQTGKFSV